MRVKAHKQTRKIYRMNKFRGVDYASSPVEVKPYRATDMANLILKDGMLHKRNGWEQIEKIVDDHVDSLNTKQYGFGLVGAWTALEWDSLRSSYVEKLICQTLGRNNKTGNYEIKFFREGELLYQQVVEDDIYRYNKGNGQAFILDEKLYIANFGYYVYGYLETGDGYKVRAVKKVANDRYNTFIPTTTINIPPISTENSYDYTYTSNDRINLLSAWRKNQLYGEIVTGDRLEYKLDGRISSSVPPEVVATFEDGSTSLYTDFKKLDANPSGTEYYWVSDSSGMWFSAHKSSKNSKLLIPDNCVLSQKMGGGTITVTFFAEEDEVKDDIDRCTIAAIFGVNGANDRIFLAGSHKNPNIVFYSENKLGGQPDPTYFPANQQLVCGAETAPISAFMRMTDGTLAVLKDVSKAADVCVYYIGGTYQSLGTGQEGNEYHQAVFNVTAGGIKQKCVSAKTVASLEGDPLFVSQEGVFGISLSSNVASAERYAKERSRAINTKLTQFDLSKASAIAYKGRYYLSVGGDNNEVYVADSRYKYKLEYDSEDSFNYEWFRWTNVPAAIWFEFNGQLHFASKDGVIYRMTDEYTDVYLASTNNGELTIRQDEDGIFYVAFNNTLSHIVEQVAKEGYAVDQLGERWYISDIKNREYDGEIFKSFNVPDNVDIKAITEGYQFLTLQFHVPIRAYWKSAVVDLDNSMQKKNLWSLSTSVMPTDNSYLQVGYKTRLKENMIVQINKPVEGASVFDFSDIDFNMYSFDSGRFMHAYRQRVFERGFIYIQLAFASEAIGDCVVTEMTLEYAPTIKNVGWNEK